MKRTHKVILCLMVMAVLLVFTLIMVAFIAIRFGFLQLDADDVTQVEKVIEETFADVEISNADRDVRILPSPDGVCRISYYESESSAAQLKVENDVLRIEVKDSRTWRDLMKVEDSFDETITLYLPQKDYGTLRVKGDSGALTLKQNFCFKRLEAQIDTGDIESFAQIAEGVEIEGSEGDVHLENVSGKMKIERSTGDIVLKDCNAAQLALKSGSGDIKMGSITVTGETKVKTTGGDVYFSCLEAGALEIDVDGGNVEGTVCSGKVFEVKTMTGSVSVPESDASGSVWKISTTTGNVEIEYEK